MKSKYGKVLQTALYQQNYGIFLVPKGEFDPRNPPGRATGQGYGQVISDGISLKKLISGQISLPYKDVGIILKYTEGF